MNLRSQMVDALDQHLAGRSLVVPEAGRDLWELFLALSRSRTLGPSAPNPIAYTEIEAYARLARWPLHPHHVDILCALDDAWLRHVARRMAGRNGREAPGANQQINAAAFDAVFG